MEQDLRTNAGMIDVTPLRKRWEEEEADEKAQTEARFKRSAFALGALTTIALWATIAVAMFVFMASGV